MSCFSFSISADKKNDLFIVAFPICTFLMVLVGEPKSRILQNDKKIATDFDMAEFLYIGSLNSA